MAPLDHNELAERDIPERRLRPGPRAHPSETGRSVKTRTTSSLIAIVLGAIVATTGDHLHVVYGVLYYPRPAVFQQAWWVFPLFLGSVTAMLTGVEGVRKRLAGAPLPASLAEAVLASTAFFVAYAFTAVAADLPNVVLLVLAFAWMLRVKNMPRWVIPVSLIAAVCGVAAEGTLSSLGLFAYVRPDFLRVPRWLPALYLHAAVAGVRIRAVL